MQFNNISSDMLPNHIGIIMDGNGRWAKQKGFPRNLGHKKGAITFKKIARYCNTIGLKYLTVYAFSTENWKRPVDEINAIVELINKYLDNFKNYQKENIKLKIIGNISSFSIDMQEKIRFVESNSQGSTGLHLNIAINYGGRNEIIKAIKDIVSGVQTNKINVEDIDENLVEDYLYTKNQPQVDLIIRTSGEHRLSNFLIWQAAYAEYVFFDVLWPDMNSSYIDDAIIEFSKRHRRFGGV